MLRTQANYWPGLWFSPRWSFCHFFVLLAVVALSRESVAQTDPAANMKLWLRADSGITTPGGAVSRWEDRSSNGFVAVQPNVSPEPVHFLNMVNGHPAVRFSQPGSVSLDWLQIDGVVISQPSYAIFAIVSDLWGDAGYRTILSNWGFANSTTSIYLGYVGQDDNGPGTTKVRFSDDVGGVAGVGVITNRQTFHLLSAIASPQGVRIYQNGRLVYSRSDPMPPRNGSGPYTIARQGAVSEYFRGYIAEVLVYDRAMTESEIQWTTDYFGSRYDLPICLSRQIVSPASVEACPWQIAAFTTAVSGSGWITYQWQAQLTTGIWTNLNDGDLVSHGTVIAVASGSSTPTLLLGSLRGFPRDRSVLPVRCVASDLCSAWASNMATLTVCVADSDDGSGTGVCDGGVTIDDLLFYLTILTRGELRADVDDGSGTGTPDGGVTIDDLLYYIARFEAGC